MESPNGAVTRSSAEVHRRLVGALDQLEGHAEEDCAASSVLRAVFGLAPPAAAVPSPTSLGGPDFVPYNNMLDESQLEAVRFALDERQPISLIPYEKPRPRSPLSWRPCSQPPRLPAPPPSYRN